MDMKKLEKERIDLYKTTVKREIEPSRILHQACVFNWRYIDAGYNLNDVLCDYDKMYDANIRFMQQYPHDIYPELGWRNPLKVTRALGNNTWIINEAGDELSIQDNCFMNYDEYDELIKDPMKFLWEKFVPRKNEKLRGTDSGTAVEVSIKEYNELGKYLGRITKAAKDEFGVASMASPSQSRFSSYDAGHELIFNVLRGLKETSKDARKDPEKFKTAIQRIEEVFVKPYYDELYKMESGSDMNSYCDQQYVMLSHSILSPNQFGTFYWPFLKQMGDYAAAKDKIIYIFLESDSERFWDYFQELPKGHFIFAIELDDAAKMKKKLTNVAIAGGFPVFYLSKKSPEDCINKAKELMDTLAPGGGYIMQVDKTLAFRNDAKPENLRALCQFMLKQ